MGYSGTGGFSRSTSTPNLIIWAMPCQGVNGNSSTCWDPIWMSMVMQLTVIFGLRPKSGMNEMSCSSFIVESNRKKKNSRTGSTTSSRISTAELQNIVEKPWHQQHRDSTRKNYFLVWRLFAKFLTQLDFRPSSWEDRLTLFEGYLVDNKKQSATVKNYNSAIKSVLHEDNMKISEDQYLLSSLIRACHL